MIRGSCLCGTVRFETDGPMSDPSYCHCGRCRKVSGAAFAANVSVPKEGFRIVSGETSLGTFSTAAGVHRVFAACCGSPLWSRRDSVPGMVRLRMGALDDDPSISPEKHIFVSSKARWYEICDALPQHAERPVAPG